MIRIDISNRRVFVADKDRETSYPFASPEAFAIISEAWLQCGWDVKYVYSFSWLGRPIVQLPEDVLRIQEIIYRVKPDVILETGIAHGGSLVLHASLLKAIGHGRVIGIDIDIREHNRQAIEAHELSTWITLIEGDSRSEQVSHAVRSLLVPGEKVLVILDSNHTKGHVLAELQAYAPLVAVDSYIVVEDGIMERLPGAPRAQPDWAWNNPKAAVEEFLRSTTDFVVEEPSFTFNEGMVYERVSYWPSAYLRRVRAS